jgi:hypothetical protein
MSWSLVSGTGEEMLLFYWNKGRRPCLNCSEATWPTAIRSMGTRKSRAFDIQKFPSCDGSTLPVEA